MCLETTYQKRWNIKSLEDSYKRQALTKIQKAKERHFMPTEWGESPIFLLLSVPCENQSTHKTMKTIGPAAGATRQFIREMTYLIRNTCWKRTKGLVWSERFSWISSEVHEKVISFARHTPRSGISSDLRCCPAQMLNKWSKCPEILPKKSN